MIQLVNFESEPRAPHIHCTQPGRICLIRNRIVEITMVHSRMKPSGVIAYREVYRCLWPLETFEQARQDIDKALQMLLRRELVHH